MGVQGFPAKAGKPFLLLLTHVKREEPINEAAD
jgi:hypothetical protein